MSNSKENQKNFPGGLGSSAPRSDAKSKTTGEALYPGDIQIENQAYLKVLFTQHVHARILSIDVTRAQQAPGVLAILTAKDVPHNRYGIEIADQPVLCSNHVRCIGDRIALVIAESEEQAEAARDLIKVDYQELPILDSPTAAIGNRSLLLHTDFPGNILYEEKINQGDVEQGFLQSDFIIEESYSTSSQEHAYLQPDAGLAWIDEQGRVVVQSAGQDPYDDRKQISSILGLPEEQVRIIYAEIGGAFGGREDLNLQVCLALAAYKLQRPIKAIWSREETVIGHYKRHPMQIRHKWGLKKDGKLICQEIEVIADAGAYASTSVSVLKTTTMLCTGPYEAPNVKISVRAIYTNNPVSGAFRGFGAPQAIFAAEAHMAHVAHIIDIDPVELRMRNMIGEDSLLAGIGSVPPRVSAKETLAAAAIAAGWVNSGANWSLVKPTQHIPGGKRRGIGIAVGWKPVGYNLGMQEQATISVKLTGKESIEQAILTTSAAEIGQGVHTVLRQIVAEELEIPLEQIVIPVIDTADGLNTGPTSASRVTLMAGNAALGAAKAALRSWQNEERPAVGVFTYYAPRTFGFHDLSPGRNTVISLGYVAQAIELEIDPETGRFTIQRLISAHDVGNAVNPQAIVGQVEGGVLQGLGWAAFEDFQIKQDKVLTSAMSTYLIPTVLDSPESLVPIILENPSPIGPFGANGVGEMPLLAVAPAVFAALHDAADVWVNEMPMTPERVWRSINET